MKMCLVYIQTALLLTLVSGQVHAVDSRYSLDPSRIIREGSTNGLLYVALTFDDGPGLYTFDLLETLDELDIRATFFVIGSNCEKYPVELLKIKRAGHEIGNHSYDHPRMTNLNDTDLYWQLTKTNDIIESLVGITPRFFRPPYMTWDQRIVDTASEFDMITVLWSVDPTDHSGISSSEIAERVLGNVRPGGIILQHEIHPASIEAVPEIVNTLRDLGYRFVTVTELLRLTAYTENIPEAE